VIGVPPTESGMVKLPPSVLPDREIRIISASSKKARMLKV
jgi:hypothetical protein